MSYKRLEIEGFIGFRLQQTAWLARGQFQKLINHLGMQITPEQAQVLLSLYKSEGVSQIQLAASVFKGRTNITRIINGLETNNLIERRKDPLDKRCLRIYLTREGTGIVNTVIPILIKANQKIMRKIGEEKYQDLMEILDYFNSQVSNPFSSLLDIPRDK